MNDATPDLTTFKVIHARTPQRPDVNPDPLTALVTMLQNHTLDPRADMRDPQEMANAKPYRGLCWGNCILEPIEGTDRKRYVGTKAIHPEHPDAVRYFGNFFEYSFAFELDTDDPALIAYLDACIAANMATPQYQQALQMIKRFKR